MPLSTGREHGKMISRHILHVVEFALPYSEIVIVAVKGVAPLTNTPDLVQSWKKHLSTS
jgi:hypothetical protein